MHSVYSFSLFPVHPSLEIFDLFPLKLAPMLFSISITDCCFIAIDVMQGILIVHKLVVVLFVDGIFLCLNLVANHEFFIVLLFLSLSFLLLSSPPILPHSQLLLSFSFVFLNCSFFSDNLLLHPPAVELMNFFFLLNK